MRAKTPYETFLLAGMLIFLSLGAIYGGISLLNDSTGAGLRLKIDEYINYPFKDFFFIGFLLLVLFGIVPLLLIFPLFNKPKTNWANVFNVYKRRHWAWTYSLYIGIMLVIWIFAQIAMIGYYAFIQIFFGIYGLLIIIVCLLPEQMKHFSKHTHHHSRSGNNDYND